MAGPRVPPPPAAVLLLASLVSAQIPGVPPGVPIPGLTFAPPTPVPPTPVPATYHAVIHWYEEDCITRSTTFQDVPLLCGECKTSGVLRDVLWTDCEKIGGPSGVLVLATCGGTTCMGQQRSYTLNSCIHTSTASPCNDATPIATGPKRMKVVYETIIPETDAPPTPNPTPPPTPVPTPLPTPLPTPIPTQPAPTPAPTTATPAPTRIIPDRVFVMRLGVKWVSFVPNVDSFLARVESILQGLPMRMHFYCPSTACDPECPAKRSERIAKGCLAKDWMLQLPVEGASSHHLATLDERTTVVDFTSDQQLSQDGEALVLNTLSAEVQKGDQGQFADFRAESVEVKPSVILDEAPTTLTTPSPPSSGGSDGLSLLMIIIIVAACLGLILLLLLLYCCCTKKACFADKKGKSENTSEKDQKDTKRQREKEAAPGPPNDGSNPRSGAPTDPHSKATAQPHPEGRGRGKRPGRSAPRSEGRKRPPPITKPQPSPPLTSLSSSDQAKAAQAPVEGRSPPPYSAQHGRGQGTPPMTPQMSPRNQRTPPGTPGLQDSSQLSLTPMRGGVFTVGETVQVLYNGSWEVGLIAKKTETALHTSFRGACLYDIDWGDMTETKNVPEDQIRPLPGSPAPRPTTPTIRSTFVHPVTGTTPPQTPTASSPHPLLPHKPFSVGDAVDVNWYSTWCPATVIADHGNGLYDVDWNDGTGSRDIPASTMRLRQEPAKAFPVGAAITALYHGKYYPAVVSGHNADGSYNVQWDDGQYTNGVLPADIRPGHVNFMSP